MKYAARVLTAMVAAAAFPVFFLAPLLKLRYSVILAGESELALSLKEIFFSGDGQLPTDKLFALDAMQPLKPAIIALCILLALALAVVLILVICSLLSSRYAATAGLSGIGAIFMLCALIPMHRVSTMLTDGSIPIGTLLAQLQETGAANAGILSLLQGAPSIADVAVQIQSVGFGAAYYLSLLIMILLLVWGLANMAIEIGAEKRPPRRLAAKKKR